MKKTLWLAIIVSTHFFCIQSAETQEKKTEKKFRHFIFHLFCPLSSKNSAALAILLQQQREDTNYKKGSSSPKPLEPYLRRYSVKLLAPLNETVENALKTLYEAEKELKQKNVLKKKTRRFKKQIPTKSNMFAGLSIE